MVLVLRSCCSGGNVIDTVAGLHEERDSYRAQANRLRREAGMLRRRAQKQSGPPDGVEKQAAALIRVAGWCETEAAVLDEATIVRDSGVVQRDGGWLHEMGIAEAIANTLTFSIWQDSTPWWPRW